MERASGSWSTKESTGRRAEPVITERGAEAQAEVQNASYFFYKMDVMGGLRFYVFSVSVPFCLYCARVSECVWAVWLASWANLLLISSSGGDMN